MTTDLGPLERARRVRELAAALSEALDDYEAEDVTHFEVRCVVGELLDRVGVQHVTSSGGTRTWTFGDGVVEEPFSGTSSPGRNLGVAVRLDAAANDYGDAIQAVEPDDEEAATTVRLGLRGLLDVVRVGLPEEWRAVVVHELAGLIRSDLRTGRFRVSQGTLDIAVEDGGLNAVLTPDSVLELERLWGDPVITDAWFAPDHGHASAFEKAVSARR